MKLHSPQRNACAALLVVAVGCFLAIRQAGERLRAPDPLEASKFGVATSVTSSTLFHVLLAMVVVLAAAQLLGRLFRLIHQPPVIGEVVAGILLGPSLVGRFAPAVSEYVLPASAAPYLGILAQVGVLLFMFLIGLELDTGEIRARKGATFTIALAGIVVPFVMGAAAAILAYPRFATSDVPFGTFALFLGVAMSITAFPVLARILADLKLEKSSLGVLALGCAAVGDAAAWCLLAFVVGVATGREGEAYRTLFLAAAYLAAMLILVRPLIRRFVERVEVSGVVGRGATAAALGGLLLSALTTEAIGIHAIFGAFVAGALVAHGSLLARELTRRLSDVVAVLFLPAFFAVTGLRMRISLVSGAEAWLACAGLIGVACFGKFGGTLFAARLSGLGWRDAARLGTLMNTRGLMELIVLNVGLDLGVISPTIFAMLVVMALVTTFLTAPVLQLLGTAADERG